MTSTLLLTSMVGIVGAGFVGASALHPDAVASSRSQVEGTVQLAPAEFRPVCSTA